MKKTLTRIFLSVCIVAMILSCMGAAAYADGDYIQYAMQGGDTVYGICKQLGIDFNSNRNWITSVNNITNFNNIKVGTVITFPLFDTSKDPTKANSVAASLGKTTAVTTGGTTGATVTTITTTTAAAAAGDTIVSYLINHPMQPGETVAAVCNALGVNFSANADKIMKLSGITNWNKIPVGKVVVIPSATAPAGTNYTAIVAHKVQAGETVGSICNSYGVSFAKTQEQLKALNSTNNLNVIKAGQIFYIPVAGAVITTTTTTGGTTTGGTTTGGTTTGGTTTPTTPTSAMNTQTGAHGSFKLQVDGKDVTSASAGQTVKIVPTPDAGYVVNSVTVLKDNGTVAVPVQGMSFTMPNSAITVNVTFKKA